MRSASELVIVSSCMPECHAEIVCIEAGTCSMVIEHDNMFYGHRRQLACKT